MSNSTKPHLVVDLKTAKSVSDVLHPIILDLTELRSLLKHCHWNVKDINFLAVHRLLDEVIAIVDKSTDEIAERIRQLGLPVQAPSSKVATDHKLGNFPLRVANSKEIITDATKGLQASLRRIREGIDFTAETVPEPVSADLLTKVAGTLEVQLWLLDSHLE